MRMIELNKILSDRESSTGFDYHTDTDEVGENGQPIQPQPTTESCIINVDAIRCFYPRKNNMIGTRITFTDGGGFAVANTYTEVKILCHML
jgi:hypothetical protein